MKGGSLLMDLALLSALMSRGAFVRVPNRKDGSIMSADSTTRFPRITKTVTDLGALYARAAWVLAQAREVMNNDGEHWTRQTLASVEDAMGVQRFCAIGGLNKAVNAPQGYVADYRQEDGTLRNYATTSDQGDAAYADYAEVKIDLDFGEQFDVLDAAKHVLASVIRGDGQPEALTPEEIGYEQTGMNEHTIYSFNDNAQEIRDNESGGTGYIVLDHAQAWKRVASRFATAEGHAIRLARDNGWTEGFTFPEPVVPDETQDADPAF